jgi:hypothetical protein
MPDMRMIKIGGVCALVVAVMQVGGNALHPPVPPDSAQALELIAATGRWTIVHLIITISYFLFIPFVIGAAASFAHKSPLVRIGTPLIIVGASLGAAQISTHLTIFKYLGDQYAATSDAGLQQSIVFLYNSFWPYSVALEMEHLLVIYVAVMMFGAAMFEEEIYPRWLAWLGIVGGVIATAGILVGKLVIHSTLGDIIFGVSLIPIMIWIVVMGIILLRLKAPAPVAGTAGLALADAKR